MVKALKHDIDVVRRKAVCALHRYHTEKHTKSVYYVYNTFCPLRLSHLILSLFCGTFYAPNFADLGGIYFILS